MPPETELSVQVFDYSKNTNKHLIMSPTPLKFALVPIFQYKCINIYIYIYLCALKISRVSYLQCRTVSLHSDALKKTEIKDSDLEENVVDKSKL